jgi:predicted AlkP superfamily pyrophosphatase or phosphodiesterase
MALWFRYLTVLLGFTATVCAREPVVIFVGIDGLRSDYLEKFQPPNLSQLAEDGVYARRMEASFPTLTFPNFYTLATGLRPERHGIIGNNMFDPEFGEKFSLGSPSVQEGKWWGGEPVWVTAQKHGLRAACMFWPGSEAEIGGMRPWEWRKFDYKVTPEDRVRTVLDWLAKPEAERPRLITLYFHEADTAGHKFGPDSLETAAAVATVDAAVGQLREGVHRLGLDGVVNYVIVSDHGMADLSPDRVIVLSEMIDLNTVNVDFSGAVAGLRPHDAAEEKAVYEALAAKASQGHFKVFRGEEMPERLHFRAHRRIPPIVLLADEGWMIIREPLTSVTRGLFQKATHGFDPELPSMGATFIAEGPAFKKGVRLPVFENIHVYNLLCALLGLPPAKNDGDRRLLDQTLAHPPK